MIPVYLCHVPSPERAEMVRHVTDAWILHGVEVDVLTPFGIGCPSPREFQRGRRVWADGNSDSDIYVLADDDCLPQGEWFVREAVRVLSRHDQFGILSLGFDNETINPWTPKGYDVYGDNEVEEHHSVGGIRFCRKGLIEEWPSMSQEFNAYDRDHAKILADKGYKVGYFRNIKCTHLGKGKSQVWAGAHVP